MLSDELLLKVGFRLYCYPYAEQYEDRGLRFPTQEVYKHIPQPPADRLLSIMKNYVGQLENAWGRPLGEVFETLQIEPGNALFLVLMDCFGFGIGLDDDHSRNLDEYQRKTGKELDLNPLVTSNDVLYDLAFEMLNEQYPETHPDVPQFCPFCRCHQRYLHIEVEVWKASKDGEDPVSLCEHQCTVCCRSFWT